MDRYSKGRLSLSDEVYNQILHRISEGEWSVGEKLPSESQLCKMFQVSRASVRAALQKLQGSGIVVTMQGVGSFVHKHTLDDEKTEILQASDITSEQFMEFFEFRQAIEFKAVDFFVRRATKEEEDHLLALVEKMRNVGGDKKAFVDYDIEFHMTVIKAAKNSFLWKAMEANKDLFYHYMVEIIRMTSKPLELLAEEHFEYYTYLKEKKAKQAKDHVYNDNTYYQVAYFSH